MNLKPGILEYQAASDMRIDWFGGDSGHIHPTQDQQLDKWTRFGMMAMAKAYGISVVRSSPLGLIVAVPRNRRIRVAQ